MTLALCLLAALHAPTAAARGAALRPLYARAAGAARISPRLLERVCGHETDHRTWVIYRGAYGLCQVRTNALPRRTFTRAELLEPEPNAFAAAAHLARDLRVCHGRVAGALARYQRGHGCEPSLYSRHVMLADVAP